MVTHITVMRSPLRGELGGAGVLESEFLAQQCPLFMESVVLRREAHSSIDAVGGSGSSIDDGVVSQRDNVQYRRLHAVLPVLR